jgi:mono/diheme cytochrome c family protein
MTEARWRVGVIVATAGLILSAAVTSQATLKVLQQSRSAGVKVDSCLDCHASPHAKEAMREQARGVGFLPTNCQGCHGNKIPGKLNAAGQWLVEQKKQRGAKSVDGAWLRDYVPAETKKTGE